MASPFSLSIIGEGFNYGDWRLRHSEKSDITRYFDLIPLKNVLF